MVLRPLDFADCLSDSPWFRHNLRAHEVQLRRTYERIKRVEGDCRQVIVAAQALSTAHRQLAASLAEFRFESHGGYRTDEERFIVDSLKEFGRILTHVEDEREELLNHADVRYVQPLKHFRHDLIGKTINSDKKKFEKASQKYYLSLDKQLILSTIRTKSKEFDDTDVALEVERKFFYQTSLDYVFSLQSIEERTRFEFVKTISTFFDDWLSFYHQGDMIHANMKPYLAEVQTKVAKAQTSFNAAQLEAAELKTRMLHSAKHNCNNGAPSIKQGYLYLLEKKNMGLSRTKFYCVYQKETRIFTMLPHKNALDKIKGAYAQSVSMKLLSCSRRASDSIDKRFCFDLLTDRHDTALTMQALTDEDRRAWLDAMDGYEPLNSPSAAVPPTNTSLTPAGVAFLTRCLSIVEERGLDEQGVYRNCGVSSKVNKLLQVGNDVTLNAQSLSEEWEIRTITSAVKTYLRNLCAPLLTFELHAKFINAAKMENPFERVDHVHYFVYQLPDDRFHVLRMICNHLNRVCLQSPVNLMTVSNMAVCFGPSLLRAKEETLSAVMDIKFCNVVVEVLIDNADRIFNNAPPSSINAPRPPKPTHNVPSSSCESLAESTADSTTNITSESSPSPVRQLRQRRTTTTTTATTTQSDQSASTDNGVSQAVHLQQQRLSISYAPPYTGRMWQKRAVTDSPHAQSVHNLLNVSHQPPYPIVSIQPSHRVRTLYDCSADHVSELSFLPGQIITNVHPSKEPGWLLGTLNGKSGLIPDNYVEPLQ